MPEGHTIHRAARDHRNRFVGHRLRVDSPQGRFEDAAAVLDGQVLESIDAAGKHLFYQWERGSILHVHLGLHGRFRTWPDQDHEPTPGVRVRFRGPGGTLHLSAPSRCRLIDRHRRQLIVRRLGPDPLGDTDGDEARFVDTLQGCSTPIGAALLDQGLVAGIGNVYRSELLFLLGVDPRRPSDHLSAHEARALWRLAVDRLTTGVELGRIVTVDPADVGARRAGEVPGRAALYVYERTGRPCRRCGTPIATTDLGARRAWWCPACQPD